MNGTRVGPLRRGRRAGACVAALFLAAAAAIAAPRIVAVGDVHGDLEAFKAILAEAGVIDANGEWAGGETVLVQVGDLIDRGPSARGTLDFVMALQPEAARHGGRVVSLLGNHEIMNMTGDLRYVAPENYAEFANAGSEKRRADAWARVRELRKKRAHALGEPEPPSGAAARRAWYDTHPPGFIEHEEAFGPTGQYGRWLRERPACFVAQDTAFLHGGLSPAFASMSLEAINRQVREELAAYDADKALFVSEGLILPFFDLGEVSRAVQAELHALDAAEAASRAAAEKAGQTWTIPAGEAERRKKYERFLDWGSWIFNAPDGPFWFRGFSRWSDAEGNAEMPALLADAGVRRFVTGHTPESEGRIRVRFDGTVFLIDTGMLAAYFHGRASALEIADGIVSAIYPGEKPQVIWRAAPRAAAAVFAGSGRPVFGRAVSSGTGSR
jgi:hypothetical protein